MVTAHVLKALYIMRAFDNPLFQLAFRNWILYRVLTVVNVSNIVTYIVSDQTFISLILLKMLIIYFQVAPVRILIYTFSVKKFESQTASPQRS